MRRSPLLVVYLTVFIDLLGFGIILPALPYYAVAFGASGLWVGALLTAYSAAQFVGAPLLGRWSDRVGRRPVILLSLAGSAVSFAATGLATSLVLLLVARTLAGLFGGSIAAAQAYIADVTRPEQRAKYMGLLGASIGMGFVLGPAIGALLSPFGFGTAAFAAAGLAVFNLAFGALALTESRPKGDRVAAHGRPAPQALVQALRRPVLGRLLTATFLATFAFVGMEATFALLGKERYGLDAAGLGLIFTFVGVIIVVVQGGMVAPLARRFGEETVASVGAVVLAAGLLALPWAPTLAVALLPLAALSVGQALVTPLLSTLVSRAASADEQGGTLGVGQALGAAARASGPVVAGALFDVHLALPYAVGAFLSLGVAVLVASLGALAARTGSRALSD